MRVSVLRIVPEHRKDGRASLPVRPSRAAPVARKSDALLRRGTIVLLLILGILCGSSGPSRRNRGTLATFAAARSQISRNLWLDVLSGLVVVASAAAAFWGYSTF